MKHTFWIGLLFLGVGCVAMAQESTPEKIPEKIPEAPQVEVVFVLDSTGSMQGLIEGAKQKIWSIANTIITQKPTPDVKIGLITYRDRGDVYVTRFKDLTTDIDAVYAELKTFQADGGNDTPESVNQALDEAVQKMSWTPADKSVYRVIFLVGDAPPHMDYQDDVKYPVTCKAALEKNILINTIQCGCVGECTPIWRDIASKAEGTFTQIAQEGGMIVRESPYDAEIAKKTLELNETVIPYGSTRQQAAVSGKMKIASEASAATNADRAKFNAFSGGKAIQGDGDLVQTLNDRQDFDLSSVQTEELPEAMRSMSPEERRNYVLEKQQRRAQINAEILELSQKRDTWLAEESKKHADAPVETESGKVRGKTRTSIPLFKSVVPSVESSAVESPADSATAPLESFDESVSEMIKQQMKAKRE